MSVRDSVHEQQREAATRAAQSDGGVCIRSAAVAELSSERLSRQKRLRNTIYGKTSTTRYANNGRPERHRVRLISCGGTGERWTTMTLYGVYRPGMGDATSRFADSRPTITRIPSPASSLPRGRDRGARARVCVPRPACGRIYRSSRVTTKLHRRTVYRCYRGTTLSSSTLWWPPVRATVMALPNAPAKRSCVCVCICPILPPIPAIFSLCAVSDVSRAAPFSQGFTAGAAVAICRRCP